MPAAKLPKWKTQWPKNGELLAWFRAGLQKCDAIDDPDKASTAAHLPIEHIAELGHTDEALKHVNKFLKRLTQAKQLEAVRMAQLGAKICLKADDLDGMEKYLTIALSAEKFITRKRDLGFAIDSVRDFRTDNGLLDPKDAKDDKQRSKAEFNAAWRRCRKAIERGDRITAKSELKVMERIVPQKEKWSQKYNRRTILKEYSRIESKAFLRKYISRFKPDERQDILPSYALIDLGLTDEAVDEAVREVDRTIKKLITADDPNIHFDTGRISREILSLIELGRKDLAEKCFAKVAKSAGKWKSYGMGFSKSAAFTDFAEVIAKLEGTDEASAFLADATKIAKADKSIFHKGAISDAIQMEAAIGKLDEAIENARKLRSPTQRRMDLAKLLAKAKRWKELREVCSEAATPEEAAELCWWIKFELPGGEVK